MARRGGPLERAEPQRSRNRVRIQRRLAVLLFSFAALKLIRRYLFWPYRNQLVGGGVPNAVLINRERSTGTVRPAQWFPTGGPRAPPTGGVRGLVSRVVRERRDLNLKKFNFFLIKFDF